MPLTQPQAIALRIAANDLAARLVPPSEGEPCDKGEWRAYILNLLQQFGPQLIALLIALLAEPKTT